MLWNNKYHNHNKYQTCVWMFATYFMINDINSFFRLFHSSRSCADTVTRGGLQVSRLLADAWFGVSRGGYTGSLSWSRDAARTPDPKHGHHDVHVRGSRLSLLALIVHGDRSGIRRRQAHVSLLLSRVSV